MRTAYDLMNALGALLNKRDEETQWLGIYVDTSEGPFPITGARLEPHGVVLEYEDFDLVEQEALECATTVSIKDICRIESSPTCISGIDCDGEVFRIQIFSYDTLDAFETTITFHPPGSERF